MKPLFWAGSVLQDLRAFPEDARRIAGHELHLVQQGLEPGDWKAMASVGPGVYELRIRTAVEHRVFYVAKFAESVVPEVAPWTSRLLHQAEMYSPTSALTTMKPSIFGFVLHS